MEGQAEQAKGEIWISTKRYRRRPCCSVVWDWPELERVRRRTKINPHQPRQHSFGDSTSATADWSRSSNDSVSAVLRPGDAVRTCKLLEVGVPTSRCPEKREETSFMALLSGLHISVRRQASSPLHIDRLGFGGKMAGVRTVRVRC